MEFRRQASISIAKIPILFGERDYRIIQEFHTGHPAIERNNY